MFGTDFGAIKNDLIESRKEYLEENPDIIQEEDVFLAAVDNVLEEIEVFEGGECNRFRQFVKITALILYIESISLSEEEDNFGNFFDDSMADENDDLFDGDVAKLLNQILCGSIDDEEQIIQINPKEAKKSSAQKKTVQKKPAAKKKEPAAKKKESAAKKAPAKKLAKKR